MKIVNKYKYFSGHLIITMIQVKMLITIIRRETEAKKNLDQNLKNLSSI